ncbi:tetratricopeptide repeat protein [Methanolobus sp. WCC5]|jgi:tetratricopeptide (TPR) repeat protein|uniref:tetratricopeptide repeat protein n=1 Tax=Methanolobus sp. WCC5 TaxID=3125785 RepID=UPI0032564422
MSKRARDMAFRHLNKGVSLIEKGLNEDALEILEQAEEQAMEAESPEILVAVLQTYANLLFSLGKNEEALKRYLAASDILEKNPEYLESDQRSEMFSNMAMVLESQGKQEDAMKKYELAALEYGGLLKREKTDTPIISNAVSTLNNMGALLAEMGKCNEAWNTFQEALDLHETLDPGKTDETEYRRKKRTILANMLNIPPGAFADREEYEEKYTGSLKMYLVQAWDEPAELSRIIASLTDLSITLEKEGQKDAAFLKLEEALEIATGQFDKDSSNADNRKQIIDILRNMSRILESEERSERSLERYDRIAEVSRKLLASMPANKAYQLNLLFSLGITGNLLKESGRNKEAMERLEEALDIAINTLKSDGEEEQTHQAVAPIVEDMLAIIEIEYDPDARLEKYNDLQEKIGALTPESLEMELTHASICNAKGRILADNGSFAQAIDNFQKAFATFETVRHATGDNSGIKDVLENIAQTSFSMGAYDDSLTNYMQLLKNGFSDKGYIDRIEEILVGKEKNSDNTGNLESLKKEYEKILGTRTELLGLVPDEQAKNATRIRVLQEKIADIMLAMEQTTEALQVYEQLHETDKTGTYLPKIVKLLERMKISAGKQEASGKLEVLEFLLSRYNDLLEVNACDVSVLANRASVIEDIGQVLSHRGETEESAYMYNYAIDAYAEMGQLDPENMFLLERTASLHKKIADIAANSGHTEEARDRYDASLERYRELMDRNPSNPAHQLDYAGVLDGMGSLYLDAGLHDKAKQSYENALRSYAAVMESEPGNPAYRTNVTITLENLGYVLELMGRNEDALWMYENSRKIEEGVE